MCPLGVNARLHTEAGYLTFSDNNDQRMGGEEGMTEKRSMKDRGEDAAALYMERVGIAVVERRFACEAGRIDIVARDGDTLVVVDVATTRAGRQGGLWTPTPAKARRVRRLARAYIEHAGMEESTPWRYDRVDLIVIAADRALLRHHRDGLSATE